MLDGASLALSKSLSIPFDLHKRPTLLGEGFSFGLASQCIRPGFGLSERLYLHQTRGAPCPAFAYNLTNGQSLGHLHIDTGQCRCPKISS